MVITPPIAGIGATMFSGRLTREAILLEFGRAERDEAEQRVVLVAINPDAVGDRRTHAAAAAVTVAAGAAEIAEQLVAFVGQRLVMRIFFGLIGIDERADLRRLAPGGIGAPVLSVRARAHRESQAKGQTQAHRQFSLHL